MNPRTAVARSLLAFASLGVLPVAQAAPTYPAWIEGSTYTTGTLVSYLGFDYRALVYQTDYLGANWNPAASPTLWQPIGADPGSPAPTTPTPTPAPTPTGSCNPTWTPTAVYTAGALVTLNSINYRANWWTHGNNPATSNGVSGTGQPWTIVASCGTAPTTTPTPTPAPTPTPTPTPAPVIPAPSSSITTGTLNFHLLLGAGTPQDTLTLDGDNYTDLIMSNLIAGAMMGHLIQEGYPGLLYNRDYLYGSIFGQLLQENIETQKYTSTGTLIDPSPDQAAVMGTGQGGPYQINNYAADMVSGSYTPGGHSLINYVALQKSIGYTFATAPIQFSRPTPPAFNDKFFGPMLTAFFHYNDFIALIVTGKGTGGWTTPWQPAFDTALVNFKSLPNNFLEVILNAAYNQGYYGPLVSSYSTLAATANPSTVVAADSFASVWGKSDTYAQYPYQVRYYLDQLYSLPIPTTSPTTMVTPTNHVAFSMPQLASVFTSVFTTLAYTDPTGHAALIPASTAQSAFAAALTANSSSPTATLDLSQSTDRAQIFNLLEQSIANLEKSLGTPFNTTSTAQL